MFYQNQHTHIPQVPQVPQQQVPQQQVPQNEMGNSSSLTHLLELYNQCQSIHLSKEQHNMYMERRTLDYNILKESNKRKFDSSSENVEKKTQMKTESFTPHKKPRVYSATIHIGNFGGKLVVKYGMVDTMGLQSNIARQIVTSFFTTEEDGKAVISKWAEQTYNTSKDLTGRDERMTYALDHHKEDAPSLSNRLNAVHRFYKSLCDITNIPDGIQKIRKKGSTPLTDVLKKIHKESQLNVKLLLAQFFIDNTEHITNWYNEESQSFSKNTSEISTLCQKLNTIFESEDYQQLPQQFQQSQIQQPQPHSQQPQTQTQQVQIQKIDLSDSESSDEETTSSSDDEQETQTATFNSAFFMNAQNASELTQPQSY